MEKKNISIGKSITDGKGVFMLTDIIKGDLVTFFNGYELKKEFPSDFEYKYISEYNNIKYVGYIIPKNGKIGQYINDYNMPIFPNLKNIGAIEDRIIYVGKIFDEYNKSCINCNVEHFNVEHNNISKESNISVISIRDIQKDEELFRHYGVYYWIEYYLRNLDPELSIIFIFYETLFNKCHDIYELDRKDVDKFLEDLKKRNDKISKPLKILDNIKKIRKFLQKFNKKDIDNIKEALKQKQHPLLKFNI